MKHEMTHDYDDIINLPHPDPQAHQRMSMITRASQFMPFAALKDDNESGEDFSNNFEEKAEDFD